MMQSSYVLMYTHIFMNDICCKSFICKSCFIIFHSSNAEIEDEKELLFRKLEQVNDDIQRKNEELKETKLEMQK